MKRSFNRKPGAGETRSCTDPWKMVFVRATGDVALCCRSRPVGNLHERPLEQILVNDEAKQIREDLLTGQLGPECVQCSERGVTSLEDLRCEVEHALFEDGCDEVELLRIQLRAHQDQRADLMRERGELLAHIENLETDRPQFIRHIENLERERARLEQELERGMMRKAARMWRRWTWSRRADRRQ